MIRILALSGVLFDLLVHGLNGLAQFLLLGGGQERRGGLPELGFRLSTGFEKRARCLPGFVLHS